MTNFRRPNEVSSPAAQSVRTYLLPADSADVVTDPNNSKKQLNGKERQSPKVGEFARVPRITNTADAAAQVPHRHQSAPNARDRLRSTRKQSGGRNSNIGTRSSSPKLNNAA